ncbi:MAG: hypothetical protein J6J70_02360, partial [Methanocorpusculaceae archaeon]|nr:hypothetical protein [Methanocorpusculaceae archaeon]
KKPPANVNSVFMTQAGVDGVWGVWKLGCNPRMNSLFFQRIFRRALRSFGDFAIGLFLLGFWLFFGGLIARRCRSLSHG